MKAIHKLTCCLIRVGVQPMDLLNRNEKKGLLLVLANKLAFWTYSSNSHSYVQKDKDTIIQFQKIKKVHVESLKSQLKESDT